MNLAQRCARHLLMLAAVVLSLVNISSVQAATTVEINVNSAAALKSLYASEPKALELSKKAAGILVFPDIVRAGLVVGGSSGDGMLFRKGRGVGYYNSSSLSVGMQAGVQKFGYAVFFMTEAALKEFLNSDGWDIGTAPTVVVVDAGAAKNMDTMTLQSQIYAFIFDQKGLMAGLALQGQKITRLKK